VDDRAAFVRAIEAAPWNDPLPRLVYADWLDEHGEVEEAARQRQYVDSERWLREFAATNEHFRRDYYDSEAERQEEETKWKAARKGELEHYNSPYEELLSFLTVQATAKDDDDYYLPFVTPSEFSDYSDELWHHFEVVTGIRPPEKYRYELPPFRCAC
jgi:uncharacterized protein (TIGR02996 family)